MRAFKKISQPPRYLSPQEAEAVQQSTPSSFAALPPALRLQLDRVRVYLCPTPNDAPPCFRPYEAPSTESSQATGADEDEAGTTSVADGSLWLTESEVSFLSPDQGNGFSVSYPVISLHAVTRSPPASLAAPTSQATQNGDGAASSSSSSPSGCLYIQLDLSAEDEEAAEDDEDSLLEMHIFTPDDESLDRLFEVLSQCASLHPSVGGGGGDSHPFAGFAPFGTGSSVAMAVDGAFDDADEDQEDDDAVVADFRAPNGGGDEGLSEAGRKTLAHLESVMVWPTDDATVEASAEHGNANDEDALAGATTTISDAKTVAAQESTEPTNTLILSNLPIEFFVPSICSALLSLLNAYGALVRWIPMPTVGRAVVVFEEVQGAKLAKAGLDRLMLPFEDEAAPGGSGEVQNDELRRVTRGEADDDSILRAKFGPAVTSEEAEPSTLSVPSTDKNFLISPPGSPPVGWEPIREDPPNRDTLAEDLMRALGELRDTQSHIESHHPRFWGSGRADAKGDDGEGDAAGTDTEGRDAKRNALLPAPEVILAPSKAPALRSYQPAWHRPDGGVTDAEQQQQQQPGEDGMIEVPGVTVQPFDPIDDDEGGPRTHLGFSISSVKATVDSMRSPTLLAQQTTSNDVPMLGGSLGLGGGGDHGELGAGLGRRITPTSRPPLNG
ncbi:hypothetical protein ACQY0O_005413 [Thecaphora frezii]